MANEDLAPVRQTPLLLFLLYPQTLIFHLLPVYGSFRFLTRLYKPGCIFGGIEESEWCVLTNSFTEKFPDIFSKNFGKAADSKCMSRITPFDDMALSSVHGW